MASHFRDETAAGSTLVSAAGQIGGSSGDEADRCRDDELLEALLVAIGRLEATVSRQIAAHRSTGVLEATVQELEADRSELARRLDAAEARAANLEAVNREVSAKLVDAMEKIRALIDTAGHR